MVDYRKLIRFGKNSLIISIPKKWAEHNKLTAGDSVMIESLSRDLIISPGKGEEQSTEREIIINADVEAAETIKRRIIAAYIDNYTTIIIKGRQVGLYNRYIRETMHGLMALEIMEESPERIIARCFMNMKEIDIMSINRKADNVLKSMFIDHINQIKQPHKYEDIDIVANINERDRDINRLTTLIRRAVRYYLSSPQITDNNKLLYHWALANSLEKIGDELKRSSRLIRGTKPEEADELIELIEMIYEHYKLIMQAFYKQDRRAADDLDLKQKSYWAILEEKRESFEATVPVSKEMQKVIALFRLIHEMTNYIE